MNFPDLAGPVRAENGAPEFPPMFRGIAVGAAEPVFGTALAGVRDGRHAAGDLLWSEREDRAVACFVLEPDVPLDRASQMVPLLMVAIGDALGAIGPPNLALTFRWPGTVLANGASAGSVRAAVEPRCGPQEVPRFLVAGFRIDLFKPAPEGEPGHDRDATFLHEEGCGDIGRTVLIEAVARHFLSWIDGWQANGFGAAHENWLARSHDIDQSMRITRGGETFEGRMAGLDENGGLLIDVGGNVRLFAQHDVILEDAAGER